MDANQIRQRIDGLAQELAGLDVKSLSLFGSFAKGLATEGSDLDFVVEFNGAATFDRFMDLKELLEGEFQSSVDLVTVRALKPVLLDQILAEAIQVVRIEY